MGTQSKDLYYLVDVSPSQPTAPVLLSTLDAHTNLRMFDSLSDYATSEREPLPTRRVAHLRECTPPYHMVNIFDEDDRIPFQKIPKLRFVMHIWVQTSAEGNFEGHFVSFHRRGDYYYVFGGEMNARLFKIHERHIATVFWEHRSVLLQLLRGDSCHAVSFADPEIHSTCFPGSTPLSQRCSSSLPPVFGTAFHSRKPVPTGQGYRPRPIRTYMRCVLYSVIKLHDFFYI